MIRTNVLMIQKVTLPVAYSLFQNQVKAEMQMTQDKPSEVAPGTHTLNSEPHEIQR
jgi:hypothetical protein